MQLRNDALKIAKMFSALDKKELNLLCKFKNDGVDIVHLFERAASIDEFIEDYTNYCCKSQPESALMVDKVKKISINIVPLIKAYFDDTLINHASPHILTDITNTIKLIRLIGSYPQLIDDYELFYTIPYDTFKLIENIVKNDPSVSADSSIKKIQNHVLLANITGNQYQVEIKQFDKIVSQVEERISVFDALKSPKVISMIEKLEEIAHALVGLTIIERENVLNGLNRKLCDILRNMSRGVNYRKVAYGSSLIDFMKSTPDIDEVIEHVQESISQFNEEYEKRQEKMKMELGSEVPEGIKNKPLDDYAFAEEREGKVPREYDNEHEKRLLKKLSDHFELNKSIDEKFATEIKSYLKKGMYKKIFHEPTTEIVYRGMQVKEEYIRVALKLKNEQQLNSTGSKNATFTFTPYENRNVTSWSSDFSIATNFAEGEIENKYMLVLEASVRANPNCFVDCVNGLYDIKGLNKNANEAEVLGIGKIKAFKMLWIKQSTSSDTVDHTIFDNELLNIEKSKK